MTRARIALALGALATGIAVALVAAQEGRESVADVLAGVAIGWAFVAAGLVAWARRPENPIGRVMVVAGFVRLGGEFCTGSDDRILFPLGHVLHLGFWAVVGYLLLIFPAGRLDGVLSRRIVMATAFIAFPLRVASLLVGGDHDRNALAVVGSSQSARVLERVESGVELVIVALIVMVIASRWRHASPRLRLAIAPVLSTGVAGFCLLLLALANDGLGDPMGRAPLLLLDLVAAGVAVGFLVGLLRSRLARSAVAQLVVDLGDRAEPGEVRDALARALRDPSLVLGYWLADNGRYVDIDGRPFELPAESEARAVSVVERDGRKIAALVHDPALLDEPELVQSVCAAAALALDNERLQAELRARLEELRASRDRIVEAADVERRRIERDLHDGTQQRLVSIAMALGLADAKLAIEPEEARELMREAHTGVSDALAELRELSHGILPGGLAERGLEPALEELVLRARLPVELDVSLMQRLPERVESTAYFVVSEALTNVAKHADASVVRVCVSRVNGTAVVEVADDGAGGADLRAGSGLRGLVDRVEATGGRIAVASPPGEGTIVNAEIPCE
jgi:signal transduction histidine kinase